ncbi:N-acetyltransferase [uncultured Roseibium sp.]|uniref:GNAT family N-acetyltransferase n=1 Tax=uncultured Roseibium sp. TaxID=1936171 RepID=UPI003217B1D3
MKSENWFIRLEDAADTGEIDALQAAAFGPGRFARTAFRVREGVPHLPSLSFVGLSGPTLAGSVRLTPITIGETPALLLGPLTVAPEFKNRGLGKLLLRTAIDASAAAGETAILLVGDAPYYGPMGFQRVAFGSVQLPGPVDPARVLIAPLNGSEPPSGPVRGGRG